MLVENNYFESTRDPSTAVFNQTNLTSVDITDNQFNDVTQILSGPGTIASDNTSNVNVAIASTDNAIAPVAGYGGLGYQLPGQAAGTVGITVAAAAAAAGGRYRRQRRDHRGSRSISGRPGSIRCMARFTTIS
ncbi:MAG: hypothetical protein WDO24_04905 [Pseudomonadota bacterium]